MDGMSWFGAWMGAALTMFLFFPTAFVLFVVFSLMLGFVLFASS